MCHRRRRSHGELLPTVIPYVRAGHRTISLLALGRILIVGYLGSLAAVVVHETRHALPLVLQESHVEGCPLEEPPQGDEGARTAPEGTKPPGRRSRSG